MAFRPGEHPRDPQGRFRDKEKLRKRQIIPQTVQTYERWWHGPTGYTISGWGAVDDPNAPRNRENAEITERMEDYGLMPCTNKDMQRTGMFMGYLTQDDAKETVDALNEEFPDRTFETIDPNANGELEDALGSLTADEGLRHRSGYAEPSDQDMVFALMTEYTNVDEWNDVDIEDTYSNAGVTVHNMRIMGQGGDLTFIRDTTILCSNTRKVRDELIRQGYSQETADDYAEDILTQDEWNEDGTYNDRWNEKGMTDANARDAIRSYDLPKAIETIERWRREHAGNEGE